MNPGMRFHSPRTLQIAQDLIRRYGGLDGLLKASQEGPDGVRTVVRTPEGTKIDWTHGLANRMGGTSVRYLMLHPSQLADPELMGALREALPDVEFFEQRKLPS